MKYLFSRKSEIVTFGGHEIDCLCGDTLLGFNNSGIRLRQHRYDAAPSGESGDVFGRSYTVVIEVTHAVPTNRF